MASITSAEIQPAKTWDDFVEYVRGLRHLEADWNGYGAAAISPAMIEAAVDCCTNYLPHHFQIPHAAYPLPDGHVVFEWYDDKKLVRQLEVEGPGRGELMVRSAAGESSFQAVTWDAPHRNGASHD